MNTSLNAVTGGIRVILTFRVRLIPNIVDPSLTTWSYEPREIILSYSPAKIVLTPFSWLNSSLFQSLSAQTSNCRDVLFSWGMFSFIQRLLHWYLNFYRHSFLFHTLGTSAFTWYYLEHLENRSCYSALSHRLNNNGPLLLTWSLRCHLPGWIWRYIETGRSFLMFTRCRLPFPVVFLMRKVIVTKTKI